ncbi:MAG: hypothetical protein JW966_04880 [Anaerolineae bacterium]|nr:hypothetical protein [Anaerolineae bacterium]
MTRLTWIWPVIIVVSAWVTGLVVFMDALPPVRPALVFWFVLVCPGMAYVNLLKLDDIASQLTLGVALSLALGAIVAALMVYTERWSPDAGLGILIGISLLGVLIRLIMAMRDGLTGLNRPDSNASTRDLIANSRLSDWLRSNWALLSNGGSIVATMAVTSGLGFVYWWLAARLYPASAVGLASAAISAMMLLGAIGMLGLGTLIIGELPRQPHKARALIMTSLIVASAAALGLGILFAAAAPLISTELKPLARDASSILLFAVGVAITAAVLVLDQALIGLLRGGIQLWRNSIFAAAKLVFLLMAGMWLANELGMTIYATWVLGHVISLGYIAAIVITRRTPLRAFRPEFRLIGGMRNAALSHHILNLSLQVPAFTLPIIVTAQLSSEVNASFYAAWMIASFSFVIPGALTTALYAVGAANPSLLAQKTRLTLKLSLLTGLALSGFLLVTADFALGLFGPDYADRAAASLRLLSLGVFPSILKVHYVAICQVRYRVSGAARLMGAGAVLEVVSATIGGSQGGLSGLSLAWVIAVCVEAVLVAPVVFRAATSDRRKHTQPNDTASTNIHNSDLPLTPGAAQSGLDPVL